MITKKGGEKMNNLMKNKALVAVVAVVIIVVAGYGGYRLYKHFKRVSAPTAPVAQVTATPTPTATPAANTVYKTANNATLGSYFTDLKGMTLYTFKKDKSGVSNCTGACLTKWPAYVATSAAASLPANISVITRTGGVLQYAYKGMPLYYYYLDKAAGDTNGQGLLGLWFVAK